MKILIRLDLKVGALRVLPNIFNHFSYVLPLATKQVKILIMANKMKILIRLDLKVRGR